ncbi:phage holin [Cytobacillus oceanisediminis]|uniref:phage holin n=1 Tax=Cytobacillus oceanisediminis TaxID=665099 RepID=UPI00254AF781|nr:phage holin [Cytobacillus oceanisediminis]MDK7664389.1 phage holin [Cytobacillus oceanisediminis]
MKNMDKGTVIRTVLLFIALINQVFGVGTIALDEGQVITVVEGMYLLGSTLFTIVTSLIAWFKNNYVTERGGLQKKALQAQKLIKK